MRRLFTCLSSCALVILLLLGDAFAQQNIIVKGTVTDAASGETLIGVSIKVKGGVQGTSSDANGNFTINVSSNAVLVFTYIGFSPIEVPVNNQTTLSVKMSVSSSALDEVVVIGYGTAAKRDLTGSIVSIKGSEVADKPGTNPVANLQGRVAGVQVTNSGRPGAEPDVRIRGTNSINNVRPLYVVDGILNDNINFLNPSDIESIEILKDPSSLAIFGVRGANGVIAVTTKQAKTGQLTFNFNSTAGIKDVSHRIKMTDASGFKLLYDEQLRNEGSPAFDYTNWQANTNWQDEIFQNGVLSYNNLSVSGATERNKFRMGLGYIAEQGVINHEQLKKITLNINDELKITDHFRVGVNFNGYRSELPQERGVGGAILAAPIAPVFNDEYGLYHTMPSFQRAQVANPLIDIELRNGTNIRREYRAVGNVFSEIDFLKNFTFRAAFLVDYGFNNGRSYSPLINAYNPEIPGNSKIDRLTTFTSVSQNQNIFTKIQSDWLITYKKKFGDHGLTATAGFTSYLTEYESVNSGRTQGEGDPIPNDPDKWYVGIGAQNTQTGSGDAWDRRTLSYLARALYNYKGKYLFNASFRRDGSSAFIQNNPWQNFGALGAGWVVSEESFMKPLEAINNLKIKGSWGILGNQNTGDNYRYPMFPLLVSNSSAVFGDNVIPAYEPAYIPDPNLRWETVHAWETGFELNAFANRLFIEANYYKKKTKDIMVEVPGILGSKPGLANQGSMTNQGIEIATSWNQKLNDDLSFTVNGNITTLNNKVNSLVYEGYQILLNASRTTIGYPIGYFYGYVHDGIYQSNEDVRLHPSNINEVFPGDIKYKDVNGDGVIDEQDRTMIGNPTPDFTYGFSLNLNYKGFDLGAEFMGVYGNEIFKNWNRNAFAQFNFQEERLDRWNGIGSSNWEPILNSSRANNRLISSYYIEDGSFFRVRNIQVGYNLNKQTLDKIKLKSLRVFLNAQNPFTFTNSTGYTPEIGGSAVEFGVDGGTYPVPSIYTIGVNLNF